MKGKSDMRMPEEFLEMDATEAELLSGGESENEEMNIASAATGIGALTLFATGGLTYSFSSLCETQSGTNPNPESNNNAARRGKMASAIMAGIGVASGVACIILSAIDDS